MLEPPSAEMVPSFTTHSHSHSADLMRAAQSRAMKKGRVKKRTCPPRRMLSARSPVLSPVVACPTLPLLMTTHTCSSSWTKTLQTMTGREQARMGWKTSEVVGRREGGEAGVGAGLDEARDARPHRNRVRYELAVPRWEARRKPVTRQGRVVAAGVGEEQEGEVAAVGDVVAGVGGEGLAAGDEGHPGAAADGDFVVTDVREGGGVFVAGSLGNIGFRAEQVRVIV